MSHNMNIFQLFLLGFSSMFPLVNPIGTALIINSEFTGLRFKERERYARRICFVGFFLGVGALFLGSWFLKFMGISIEVTQMGGGIIIAHMGMGLLNSENTADSTASATTPVSERLFFPLAFPLTIGPGCVSALIALSAHAHVPTVTGTIERTCVLAVSLLAVLGIAYLCFTYSHFIMNRIGAAGSQIVNRLMSFFLFCIGIQMLVNGLANTYPKLFQ